MYKARKGGYAEVDEQEVEDSKGEGKAQKERMESLKE